MGPCGTCRFWLSTDRKTGICRLSPLTVKAGPFKPSDGCGDWNGNLIVKPVTESVSPPVPAKP